MYVNEGFMYIGIRLRILTLFTEVENFITNQYLPVLFNVIVYLKLIFAIIYKRVVLNYVLIIQYVQHKLLSLNTKLNFSKMS